MGEALQQFITVRYVQADRNAKAVIRRFGVQAFPTLLILGPDGAEWDEIGGGEGAGFVKELERVRSGKDTLPTLRAAVQTDPADAKAAASLANYLANRYAAESIALCRKARKLVPAEDEEAMSDLLFVEGYAESNRGGNEKALALFERVIKGFPKSEAAKHACIFARNVLPLLSPERGLAFIAKALPLVNGDERSSLEYTRGYLYLKAAEAEWLRRGNEAGDEPEVLNNVAWECYQHGWHTREAIGWARTAVKLSERKPHILDTLAHLLFKSGDVRAAIKLEEEALATVKDARMRFEFEETLLKWNAAKVHREAHRDRTGTR